MKLVVIIIKPQVGLIIFLFCLEVDLLLLVLWSCRITYADG